MTNVLRTQSREGATQGERVARAGEWSGAAAKRAVTNRRPRTEKQRAASARNGAKSRGPRTPEGKARSRSNAWRSGLFAAALRPFDHGGREHLDFYALVEQLAVGYAPAGPTARVLV